MIYVLVGIISFLGGLFLMNFINLYYLKIILMLILNHPESLQDSKVQEYLEAILG